MLLNTRQICTLLDISEDELKRHDPGYEGDYVAAYVNEHMVFFRATCSINSFSFYPFSGRTCDKCDKPRVGSHVGNVAIGTFDKLTTGMNGTCIGGISTGSYECLEGEFLFESK